MNKKTIAKKVSYRKEIRKECVAALGMFMVDKEYVTIWAKHHKAAKKCIKYWDKTQYTDNIDKFIKLTEKVFTYEKYEDSLRKAMDNHRKKVIAQKELIRSIRTRVNVPFEIIYATPTIF